MDATADQQESSRDYATGIRLAFADLRRQRRYAPELTVVETDGAPESVRLAIDAIAKDPSQVALVGVAAERLALNCVAESARKGLNIANVAPWLADSRFDADPRLFGLFASRADQIKFVLGNLAQVGVTELGVIYPSAGQALALQSGTVAITDRLRIRTRAMTIGANTDITHFAAGLPTNFPFFILFMGSSIELALFTRGVQGRGSQRYVICLADADPNTFKQLQPGRAVSVIFTQVVPNSQSSKVQIVRSYQEALLRLMDEAPSPLSLAGYLAGRYAASVLGNVPQGAGRERVLAEFRRRQSVELDGWRFAFGESGRASSFVSQTLLGTDGKLVD